jgi:8-oxo-dGTP diphosphatase
MLEQGCPRFGDTPKPGQRYVRRAGVYALSPLGGQLLVTFQGGAFDEFQLPGGGIDPGESPVPALHREVMEETGWIVGEPRRLGVYRRFVWMPEYAIWAEKVCSIYLATPIRRLGPPTEPEHTAHWMPVEMASELLASPGDRHFAARWAEFSAGRL